jgi:hypothetical protein
VLTSTLHAAAFAAALSAGPSAAPAPATVSADSLPAVPSAAVLDARLVLPTTTGTLSIG